MTLHNPLRTGFELAAGRRRAACGGAMVLLAVFASIGLLRPREAAAQGSVPVTTVSAASFEREVAPGSIAAAFGVNLATATAKATRLPLPTTLGGTTVEVNGARAGLFFVSQSQINFEVPSSVQQGAATVVVRAGDGTVSNGTAQIRTVAPGVFTANSNGQGVPAGLALRVKADGSLGYEQISVFDEASRSFVPKPISLGPVGDQVFLILFGTGLRLANNTARALLSGREVVPAFAGAVPGFVGLDQINLELPRSLIGAGPVNIAVTTIGATPFYQTEIIIAGPTGAGDAPTIAGFNPASALAGQPLTILGTNFSPSLTQNRVQIGGILARVISASTNQITITVPYGVESAPVTIITTNGQVTSAAPLAVRTSITGIVEDTNRMPLANVTVRLFGTTIATRTNAEGIFTLPDVPAGTVEIEIDGSTASAPLPFPRVLIKARVTAGRDNVLGSSLALQPVTGPSVGDGTPSTFQVGNVVLTVPSGAAIRASDGANLNSLTLALADPNQLPAPFPQAHFSSTVAQITPFGATISPGGRLTLPNTDRFAAGATATLFQLDQTAGSPTLGSFVVVGVATVTSDGQRIETTANAIRSAGLYFASAPRQETTVIGRTLEADGTPARQATVRVRGKSQTTDGTGSYTVQRVPVNPGDRVAVEASIVRQGGGVDRAASAEVVAEINGSTTMPDIRFPPIGANRPPMIAAPSALSVSAGETRDFAFNVTDPDPNQTVVVTLSEIGFASAINQGQGAYLLRLMPNAIHAGRQTLRVTATDNLGASTSAPIEITVNSTAGNRQPVANAASVTTNEDNAAAITLTGSDPDNDTLRFTVTSDPQSGRLTGAAPNLTYTPNKDFNGADSFQFRVDDGNQDSATVTVSITVNPINDPPMIDAPDSRTTSAGRTLSFTVSAADVDAGQTLSFSAAGLPSGATFAPASATSAQFTWTPTVDQAGSYQVMFTVRDNGSPALQAGKTVVIKVGAPMAMNQFVRLREDTEIEIMLEGEDGGGLPLSFVPVTQPQHGALIGTAPRLIYRPRSNYEGSDNFMFKVNNGQADSADAVVAILIDPVNDPPVFNALGDQRVRAGESLVFAVSATDVDARTLTFSRGGNLPENVIFDDSSRISPTSQEFYWTPTASQVGSYTITFGVIDDGAPRQSATTQVTITVEAGTSGGADWVKTLGAGAQITALAFDGANLYASTPANVLGSSILRSINQGQSFTLVRGLPSGISASALAINGQSVFVGNRLNEGVFRSIDGGQIWREANRGLTNKDINMLAVIGPAIYAGTDGGLFRSTDNGENWSPVNEGLGRFPVRALLANGQTLFAGTEGGGLFVSANNAQSWTPSPIGPSGSKVLALALGAGALLAGTQDSGIFRSTDNGATWAPVANGLPANLQVRALAAAPGAFYAGTIHGVFVSTDGGVSWRQINSGLFEPQLNSLAVTNNAVLVGTRQGSVFRRTF